MSASGVCIFRAQPRLSGWTEKQRRNILRYLSSALVFVATAALSFALLVTHGTPAPVLVSPPGIQHPELGLRADSQGDRLLVTWNRLDPAVAAAKSGSLRIKDGPQSREVHLDTTQLKDGSISYRPLSNDVTFQLQVAGSAGSAIATLRVLDGTTNRAGSQPMAALGPKELTGK